MSDIATLSRAVDAAGVPNNGVWKDERAEYFVHFKPEADATQRQLARQIITALPLRVAKADRHAAVNSAEGVADKLFVSAAGFSWTISNEFLLSALHASLQVTPPLTVDLRDAAGTLRTVSFSQLLQIIAALVGRLSLVRSAAATKRVQVDAATTVEQVNAVDLTMP